MSENVKHTDSSATAATEKKAASRITWSLRTFFGIFMIIVYVGMGIALLCNAFPWISGNWAWLRWTAGILLIIYGAWRGYRQFTGIDSPY